ncbi:MAG: DUF302 domain-containing protein [Bilophila wadsworthia]
MHTTEGLVSKPCAGSVETVWNRLLETLKTLNVPLFATVDHAANARAAGLFMPETRVAFFGKPAVGTHLMLERPEVALELPLRIVISEVPGEGTMLSCPTSWLPIATALIRSSTASGRPLVLWPLLRQGFGD